MPKKRLETSGDEKSSEINDLKLIDGIGPAIERHLHKVNIYTYAQLAALSPADIAAAVASISGVTSERIIKQDWIGQARKLALEPMPSEAQEEVEAPDESAMPPIVSEVELSAPVAENIEVPSSLVPEPEAVISTPQVTEPSSPVIAPIVSEVELSAPVAENIEVPSSLVPEPEAVISTPQVTEPSSPVVSRSNTMEDQQTPPVVLKTEPVGVARLRQVEMIPAETSTPQQSFPYGQSFYVRLTLDLGNVKTADNTQLSYSVSIYAKNLEEHSRQTIAESSDIIAFTDKVTISVGVTPLPKGTYRLKAVVILNPTMTEPTPQTSLVTSKESDLILIF